MSITYLDLKISLPQTHPQVWRRVHLPDYAHIDHLLTAISLVFSWDGEGHWDVSAPRDRALHAYFEEHDTLLLDYEVGGHRWTHHVTCMNKEVQLEQGHPRAVLIAGEHLAPFEDIDGPEEFARLCELRQAHLAGETISQAQMPEGYTVEELDLLDYDQTLTRELLEQGMDPELDTTLSELFTTHFEEHASEALSAHDWTMRVFAEIESGVQWLGLERDYVLMAFGYMLMLPTDTLEDLSSVAENVFAAALVKLIDDIHIDEQDEALSHTSFHVAFAIPRAAQHTLVELLERMRPHIEAIDTNDAGAKAMGIYEAASMGVGSMDELSSRQRAEVMWREPVGVEMLEWCPQRDFIMYVMCQKFDPRYAPEDEDPPDYLFIATDEVQDIVLAMLPWYGELDQAQRDAALCRTVIIACGMPSEGEPARPVGIVLESNEEARAVEGFYPFEDTPVMSMSALTRQMNKGETRKSTARRKSGAKTKSAQKKARRRQRKKK